jgi:TonB family protein
MLKGDFSPFSFLKSIFIPAYTVNEDLDAILKHERVHVRQRHSLDLIFFEILTIIMWFNPLLRLYKRSLREVHEFLADKEVLCHGGNKSDYQKLLLRFASAPAVCDLSNNLNASLIKRRIIMMNKKFRAWRAYPKLAGLGIFATALFIIFACARSEAPPKTEEQLLYLEGKINSVLNDKYDYINGFNNQQPTKVDEYPKPKVSWEEYRKYETANLKYPDEASKINFVGQVNLLAYIDENGKISNPVIINTRDSESDEYKSKLGYGCDEEAIRFVKAIPDWNPAMYQGKPCKTAIHFDLIFGDQDIWFAKTQRNMMSIEPIYDSSEDSLAAIANAKADGKHKDMNQESLPFVDMKFLTENLVYPEKWKMSDISGYVNVSFIIDKDGSIKDPKIERSINPDFDNEVLRVINIMPKPKPEIDRGVPVKTRVTLPVYFKLGEKKK